MNQKNAEAIRLAAMIGADVSVDFSNSAVAILRGLADDIEAGRKQVGKAEMQLEQGNKPYFTYAVSVKQM
ncbi:hypothetical protein SAMN05216509_5337 [Pseudomonas sp. B10]|uniref:hypothetical protein n=1 Tax=Pseudomonas sp. B10 TaxID=118613 RepID=UPI00095394D5|nr:hypothetical protein [Pseudomonas sp. B10]SIR84113.1 hypothetical protein SAMN05216509_5337 [Pseudomonas sp. B10]